MSIVRCALLNEERVVVDLVLADPSSAGNLVPSDHANIGDTYDGTKFTGEHAFDPSAVVRCAVVESGVVTDVVMADPATSPKLVPSETARIGNTYDGSEFAGDAPFEPFFATADTDLQTAKAARKAAIDAAAEAERLKYITGGTGQAMTYSQKADEARRYLAATDPDPADYPLLSAEVGITAPDLAGVAAIVDAAYRQWQVIGAAIEAARLGTKAAIDAATTIEEAQTAYEAAVWPNPQT